MTLFSDFFGTINAVQTASDSSRLGHRQPLLLLTSSRALFRRNTRAELMLNNSALSKANHTTSRLEREKRPHATPATHPKRNHRHHHPRRRCRCPRRENISCLSRLDHDRMVGMLLHEANRCLSSIGDGNARRRPLLGPADIRGVCVWGNHSNSQVRLFVLNFVHEICSYSIDLERSHTEALVRQTGSGSAPASRAVCLGCFFHLVVVFFCFSKGISTIALGGR